MTKKIIFIFLFTLIINNLKAEENTMILKLKDGVVEIELLAMAPMSPAMKVP